MTDNQRYFTLLTDKGKFKIAKAAANKSEVKLTHFAIGDGNGQEVNPSPTQTALVHEVWRTQLDSVEIDPQNPAAVIINAIIPHDTGGWWMREFGIFDFEGDMLAVVKPSPYYKATSAEGQIEDIFYEFQLVIGEQAEVIVLVDPSILWATREYVETRRISAAQLMNTPWLPIKSMTVTTPPTNAAMGDTYIIPSSAKNDWLNKTGQLAEWNGKEWKYSTAPDGHGVGLPDGRVFIKTNGAYIEKLALDTQSGKWIYAEASGNENILIAVLTPAPKVLPKQIIILPKYDNTGPATLILNDIAQVSILSQNGSALVAGDLKAGTPALLALMANGNYTLTNAASAPPPGTGFAGSKTFFSWKPTAAATSNLEASFIAPCVGIIMAFSTANKSYYASDGNVKNSVSVNNSSGNSDWVSASSVSTSILLVAKGTACTVKSSVSVDKGLVAPVSQYLNYVFIPA